MVFLIELMIFMVLDTMAPRSRTSKEKHASQNRHQTAIVFVAELMMFMVFDTMIPGARFPRKNMLARTVVKQLWFSLQNC